MEFRQEFASLYANLGIYETSLHLKCSRARECWHNGEERYPVRNNSFISAPWVGKHYSESGLLFLGKNLNECGGFPAIETCIRDASYNVERNKTNIFAWTGILGLVILEKIGKTKLAQEDLDFRTIKQDRLEFIFNYIAFTNMIKCSPVGFRSTEITEAMWPNCLEHILLKELSILKPKIIVCFGLYGMPYLMALMDKQFKLKGDFKGFKLFENKEFCPRYIVGTYHPAYPKQSNYSTTIIDQFKYMVLDLT